MIRRPLAWYRHARRWGYGLFAAVGFAYDLRAHEPYTLNPYGGEA